MSHGNPIVGLFGQHHRSILVLFLAVSAIAALANWGAAPFRWEFLAATAAVGIFVTWLASVLPGGVQPWALPVPVAVISTQLVARLVYGEVYARGSWLAFTHILSLLLFGMAFGALAFIVLGRDRGVR